MGLIPPSRPYVGGGTPANLSPPTKFPPNKPYRILSDPTVQSITLHSVMWVRRPRPPPSFCCWRTNRVCDEPLPIRLSVRHAPPPTTQAFLPVRASILGGAVGKSSDDIRAQKLQACASRPPAARSICRQTRAALPRRARGTKKASGHMSSVRAPLSFDP